MKTQIQLRLKHSLLAGAVAALWLGATAARADLVGPYTADANTLFLLHFDGVAGGSLAPNSGSKGGNFYSCDLTAASATPPTVTTMLGAPGYVNGLTNYNNCMTNPAVGYLFGYDANNSGAYQGEGTAPAADALGMTNLNIGVGGQSPFTLEALIRPTTLTPNQEIICTDSSGASRAFQFRIGSGTLQFAFIAAGGSGAVSGTIPTTGGDAFVPGTWYHVAMVYNGTVGTLYWTRLDPTNGAAHVIGNPTAMTLGAAQGAILGPLCIGNENRAAAGEWFQGCIDEVRVSKAARAANQMQFNSPKVTFVQNPISQNVDYNQPVTFTAVATSDTLISYQWRFNSNSIAGATNTSYVFTNVAAGNAGYYDCVATNTAGYASTSSVARLVVGAANFLNHRYSFTGDTSDSIGNAWGTNMGNATIAGGKLVLDGTAGTYMELPGNLYNGAEATALTIEAWAEYGANANNAYLFSFGYTNFVFSFGIVGVNYLSYSPHTSTGQGLFTSASSFQFEQSVAAPGSLDGSSVHVVCVMDPPNKTLAIYTNGVLEAINTNLTVNVANLNDALSYIGGSLSAADPTLNASIDEIRIFKGALSSISIKQSQDQGPDTVLADGPAAFVTQPVNTSAPVGQTATFTAAAVGYLPITYQWFTNGAPVPGGTNATYSLVTTLADNNASIRCFATNTIGVTTYVTNSTTATLSVYVPPTLAWLDGANGGADSSWNTTSLNWTNNVNSVVVFSQTDGVVFDSRGSGSPTVDLDSAITPSRITVNAAPDYLLTSSAQTGSLVGQGSIIKQNSGTLTIDVTNKLSGGTTISGGKLQIGNGGSFGSLGTGPVTNNATLSFNRSDTALAVANAIHGSGAVSFDGFGAVTLTGNNDYSGSTFVNAGIAYLTSGTGLGAASGGTAVANGAQLYITANVNVAEGLTLSGAGDGNGALRKGGAGITTNSAAATLAADATIGVDGSATLVLDNVVSGTASLTAVGNGTLALNANNSFSGGFVLNGSIVDVNANRALGPGPVTVNGAGRFVIADGLNITNAFTAYMVSPATLTGLLMVNDNTNGTVTTISGPLEFDATPANGGHFVGPISSGYLNVTGPVTNTATGVVSSRIGLVRFSGGGNYTTFNANEGTVSLGANNGLCPDAMLVLAGSGAATFDLNGFGQALTGLADGAANAELVTNGAPAPATLTMNLLGGYTYSGVLAGNLGLVVNGAGSLYLAGANNYSGNTTVNGGTLAFAQASLAAGSTVAVASGATLQMDFAETNTIAGLVLGGVSQPLGVYSATTSPSFLTGSGSLQVAVTVANYPTNIVTSFDGTNLTLSWPASHKGWILQTQTNNLSTGLSTNWYDVAGSQSSTQAVITINPANPAVFQRLRHP